jgi:hypothetical protein
MISEPEDGVSQRQVGTPGSRLSGIASQVSSQHSVADQKFDRHSDADPADIFHLSRTLVNFWLDVILMLVFTVHSIASVIVQFVFPPGVAAKGWMLWGLNYGQWCSLQFGMLSLLGFGIVVHVMLHWTWICGVMTRKILNRRELPDDGIRTLYGVGLLIILLASGAAVVGFAMLTIRMPPQ